MEKALKFTLPKGKFTDVSAECSTRMSKTRGKGNRSTELRLRFALVKSGIRGWRLHPKDVIGCPDFYFSNERIAIFVDGCFWHNCQRCGNIPRKHKKYWVKKFQLIKARSRRVNSSLSFAGTTVIRIWEHQVRNDLKTIVRRIAAAVRC
jgi:DNA mismatch endonuclease, patch repair protein